MMMCMDPQPQDVDAYTTTTPPATDGPRPPLADSDGHGRTVTDSDGQRRPLSSARKTEAHTMSSSEASIYFEHLGIARSQRSMERYCKSGDLDGFFDPDVRQWFITPESVERLASFFIEVAQKKGTTTQPTATPTERDGGGARRPMSESVEAAGEIDDLRRYTKDLEAANRDLEIASRVKDQFIERLEKDRERIISEQHTLIERIEQRAHQVGVLEAKLHALEAPRQERPTQSDTPYQTPHYGSQE
jgi:hypothetical protein